MGQRDRTGGKDRKKARHRDRKNIGKRRKRSGEEPAPGSERSGDERPRREYPGAARPVSVDSVNVSPVSVRPMGGRPSAERPVDTRPPRARLVGIPPVSGGRPVAEKLERGPDRREGFDRRAERPSRNDQPNRDSRPDRDQRPSGGDRGRERFGRGRAQKKSRDDGPVVIVQGEVQKNRRGFAFLLRKPDDIFIPPEHATKLLSGDQVKVWLNPRNKEIVKLETVKRMIKGFIGTYHAGFDKRYVVLTDRTMEEEVEVIERPNIPGLAHGDKVLVEITKYEPHLQGRVTRTFGATLAPKFDTLAVVVKSQWPQEFSAEAIADAERLSRDIQAEEAGKNYKGRKDFRERPFVTIDGPDARDFDDAVLVERTDSGYVLYVAIADVSEFVRPGTKLNEEAFDRATSVYFPEWVIPMLPEALSNGACSLRPNEEKLTLTCEMHYDKNGKKKATKVYESVIKSSKRYTYEDAYKEWKEGSDFWVAPFELYKLIRMSRTERGALDLDLPESKIVLDENSDTIDIKKTERLDSHRLIEEFMIAANESVTEIMEREELPFVYRVHEPPQTEALERFEKFALALGLRPKFGDGKQPKLFSRFIETLKDNPLSQTLYYLILRSLKQARYDAMNLKHFGLASEAYTHFTSPIRRYPDLIVHRLLKKYVRREQYNDAQYGEMVEYLEEACDHCSKRERKAEELDRTVTKVKKARFMAKHMGEEFEARITNVNENGLFIELVPWFVDGLIPIAELGEDYFEFIDEKMMLKGKRSGKKYKIGDSVHVSVLRTDVDNGFVDFTLAENLDETGEDRKTSYPGRKKRSKT